MVSIILYAAMIVCITGIQLLIAVPFFLVVISFMILLANGLMIFGYSFHKKHSLYKNLFTSLEALDQKYLVHELIALPNDYEGQLLYSLLMDIDKATMDYLNSYKYLLNDFKEYLELWIHEIKIPLAAAMLIVENNKDVISINMLEELNRVEALVEQVLFYVRSENVEKDYSLKQCSLQQIVNDVIKANRRVFIYKKISLQLDSLDIKVLTDAKWMTFILNQIIANALKYSKPTNANIHIYAMQNDNNVYLKIADNGIGISTVDIKRVFEKGFTGENGRKNYNSTGIGLYLCKNLCEKLHHQLFIESKLDEGTTITIVFPLGAYSNMIKE